MTNKVAFLVENGWKFVYGWWEAPITFTGKPLYFDLDAAYALETTGEGIMAYAAQELTGELLRAKDVALAEAAEARFFAENGYHRGVSPNY
jgi:hypothetical protein